MSLPFKGIGYEMTSLIHWQGPGVQGRSLPCSDFELNAVECLEAHGSIHGSQKCAKLLEDFHECKYGTISKLRQYVLKIERAKKVAKGQIPWEKRWGNPYPYDSYTAGTFIP